MEQQSPRPSDFAFIPVEGDLDDLRHLEEGLDGAAPATLKAGEHDLGPLPPVVEAALRRIVAFLARNRAVTVQPYDQLLTTQEAADILKVSRPFVIKLIDRNEIPAGPSAGTHRRVWLKDVVSYQRQLATTGESRP